MDAAAPVVQAGVKVAGDVAAPALKAVEPSVKVQLGPGWGWGQLGLRLLCWALFDLLPPVKGGCSLPCGCIADPHHSAVRTYGTFGYSTSRGVVALYQAHKCNQHLTAHDQAYPQPVLLVTAHQLESVPPVTVQAGLTDAQKAVAGVVDPSAIKQVTTTAEAAVTSAKPWVDQVGVCGHRPYAVRRGTACALRLAALA